MNEENRKALCSGMAKALPLLRKATGVTQERFASLAGITRNTVIRIERDRSMGWNTFLSLMMIFSAQEEAMKLIRAYDLYPAELERFLTDGKKNGDMGRI